MPFPPNAKLTGLVQTRVRDKAKPTNALFTPETTDTRDYEFDKITNNSGVLVFRNPDSAAGIVKLTSKTRTRAKLHILREKKQFPESLVRLSTEPGTNNLERFNARLKRELEDLDNLFEDTMEYWKWKLLTTGTLTITGEDPATYAFGLTNYGTVSAAWNVPASSVPLTNLNAMKETVRKTWGVGPTELYIGSQALNYLMQSAETDDFLSDQTKKEYLEKGSVKKLADLDVFICDHGYTDSAGAFKYFLSTDGAEADMAIVKAPGEVGLMVEGPAFDSKAPDGFLGKFVKSWEEEDPAGRWALETWTALPGLTMQNKMYVATLW
ncbi:MAG TPA: major capsid protein [Candidatus Krumholzibacteria bacterium]|nr:major capsid protein [Candidatus Krumholzibacteria bacterium]